jgi:hypothetical protein
MLKRNTTAAGGSAPVLLRPSDQKPLDAIQHELVVVRPLQRRPDLT